MILSYLDIRGLQWTYRAMVKPVGKQEDTNKSNLGNRIYIYVLGYR